MFLFLGQGRYQCNQKEWVEYTPNGLINRSPSNVSSKPRAVVVYNYVKKENQEMSLGKSQFVTLFDSKKGYEWCTAQDSIGRQGFYPSHYLKMIERCFSIFVQSTRSIHLSHCISIIFCSK